MEEDSSVPDKRQRPYSQRVGISEELRGDHWGGTGQDLGSIVPEMPGPGI
jgi:hypothetical protein